MFRQDTEAAICDIEIPQVDPQVISWQVSLTVAVNADGVNVIGMSISEHTPWRRFHQQIHRP